MAWKPDYITDTELKSFLRIDDTDDDTELGFAITAGSRAVDRATNRQFGKTDEAESRLYTAEWSRRLRRWVIVIDDIQTTTGLAINADLDDDGTFDDEIDDYDLEPINAAKKGKPYERIVVKPDSTNHPSELRNGVQVAVDQWGWDAVPDTVKQATLLQSSRFHARRFSPYGVAGSPDTGSELRLLARVDPDVAVALSDYVRRWGAV